jgi:hypothetical protein
VIRYWAADSDDHSGNCGHRHRDLAVARRCGERVGLWDQDGRSHTRLATVEPGDTVTLTSTFIRGSLVQAAGTGMTVSVIL